MNREEMLDRLSKGEDPLELSIEVWEEKEKLLRCGTSLEQIDVGAYYCPLCEVFFGKSCRGCAVSEKTGRIECKGTPFKTFAEIICSANPDRDVLIEYAHFEVEFLKSLRLKEGSKPRTAEVLAEGGLTA